MSRSKKVPATSSTSSHLHAATSFSEDTSAFDPMAYAASQGLLSETDALKRLSERIRALAQQQDASARALTQEVVANYKYFIDGSREIRSLDAEVNMIRNNLLKTVAAAKSLEQAAKASRTTAAATASSPSSSSSSYSSPASSSRMNASMAGAPSAKEAAATANTLATGAAGTIPSRDAMALQLRTSLANLDRLLFRGDYQQCVEELRGVRLRLDLRQAQRARRARVNKKGSGGGDSGRRDRSGNGDGCISDSGSGSVDSSGGGSAVDEELAETRRQAEAFGGRLARAILDQLEQPGASDDGRKNLLLLLVRMGRGEEARQVLFRLRDGVLQRQALAVAASNAGADRWQHAIELAKGFSAIIVATHKDLAMLSSDDPAATGRDGRDGPGAAQPANGSAAAQQAHRHFGVQFVRWALAAADALARAVQFCLTPSHDAAAEDPDAGSEA